MNKKNPLFVKYKNYYYHLSRYSNKIDRLYLQKYILRDDKGLITKDEKNTTHWGYASFSGDTYSTGDKRDLMNEGSSSRLYSFNIFINPEVVYYNRSYKKLFIIIANGLPNVSAVFTILRIIVKLFMSSLANKKLTELLFENLQEKPTGFNNTKSVVFKSGGEKNTQKNKISDNFFKISKVNNIGSRDDKKDGSSLSLYLPNDKNREINKDIIIKRKSTKHMIEIPKIINDVSSLHSYRLNFSKKLIIEDKQKVKNNNNINISQNKKYYIRKQLFPYKYYLYSKFWKNIGISRKSIFFTENFVVVYNFVCKLIDISSYLMLQKEFQILKNTLIIREYKQVIENTEKININDKSFDIDIKKCLELNKFPIYRKSEKNE